MCERVVVTACLFLNSLPDLLAVSHLRLALEEAVARLCISMCMQ